MIQRSARGEAWDRFVMNNYGNYSYLSQQLLGAYFYDTINGLEIRIPVYDARAAENFNAFIGELMTLINLPDSEFSPFLPVHFAYLLQNGTVVQAKEVPINSMTLNMMKKAMQSPEDRARENAALRQKKLTEEMHRSFTALSALSTNDNPSLSDIQCRDEFRLILEEIQKAIDCEPSFVCADHLLSSVKEPLRRVEKELGPESDYYKQISNLIVNNYLNIIIQTANKRQTISNLEEVSKRTGQLYSYAISDLTKQRVLQTAVKFGEIRSSIKHRQEVEKASRLSERIKNFALSHSSVPSGGKRYTSPALALISLIIMGFGSIISFFEWIFSLFSKKNDD